MKKILSILGVAIALFTFTFASPALAGNAAAGGGVFNSVCITCHMGGGNIINPGATLSKADLEKNGKASLEAIIKQVTYGKPPMPAFGSSLTPEQIEDVATYVLSQADKGW